MSLPATDSQRSCPHSASVTLVLLAQAGQFPLQIQVVSLRPRPLQLPQKPTAEYSPVPACASSSQQQSCSLFSKALKEILLLSPLNR